MLVQRPVQSRHPYVALRGGVYCFRFALPRHVRRLCPELPREIKRTLRTDSYPEALYLVDQKSELIRRIKQSKATLQRLCGQLGDFGGAHEDLASTALSEPQRTAQSVSEGQPKGAEEKVATPSLSAAWKAFAAWKKWPEKTHRNNQFLMDNLLLEK